MHKSSMSNVNLHEAFHCTKKVPLIIPLVSYMLMHLVRLFFFTSNCFILLYIEYDQSYI